MDPLHLCIALGPIAAYAFILGAIHLSRRAFVVSGVSDVFSLGLAVMGLVIVGPLELFYPERAPLWYGNILPDVLGRHFGAIVWLLMVSLYLMSVLWFALSSRPRLVIYNLPGYRLRPLLEELVPQLDLEARWLEDSVALPNLKIHVSMETQGMMRCIQIVSVGARQDVLGWRKLQTALRPQLARLQSPLTSTGIGLLALAAGILLLICRLVMGGSDQMRQIFLDMLRI